MLGLRYDLKHSMEDLVHAEVAWLRALANSTNDSSRAKYLYFLGQTSNARYRLLKNRDDLEQAIQYLEDAARLETSMKRNDALNLLAFMLRDRYPLTGNLNDLRRANQVWKESVSLLPMEDETIPDKLRNISAIQAKIYAITQQRTDLEENITYWKNMLNQMPETMTVKAVAYNFLGYCLTMRFEFTHNLEDLDEALQAQEQAVALVASHSEEYTDYLQNIHIILSERYKVSPTAKDREHIKQIEEEIGQIKHEA